MSLIGDFMKLLVESGSQGGQPAGQDTLSQMVGGLVGAGQGNAQANQALGMLEQLIGSGNQGAVPSGGPAANNPMLNLVGPMAEQLSSRTGLDTQTAQAVVSLILHRMLASHPSFGRSNMHMNLAEVLQQLAATGNVNPELLHNSGMVNDLVRASGMDQQAALQNLSQAFNLLGGHVQNSANR